LLEGPEPQAVLNQKHHTHDHGAVTVFGGTGFLGRPVVRALAAAGADVRVVARRRTTDGGRPAPQGVSWVVGDAADPATVSAAADGADWLIYAVGCPPPARSGRPRAGAVDANRGLETILHYLRSHPEAGLTFLSSGGAVYGDADDGEQAVEGHVCRPRSHYGWAKLEGESAVRRHRERYGNPAMVLRIGNAYGPGQTAANGQGVVAALLQAALQGEPVNLVGDGSSMRDYVYLDDVVRAVLELRPGTGPVGCVNVGTGVGTSVVGLLALVEAVTGCELGIRRWPERPTDVRRIVLDTSLLRSVIEWRPVPLAEGLERSWRHLVGARLAATVAPIRP
jgi:UDP-glucose 4-epimerase